MIYPSQSAGDIGSLLRLIQEEKARTSIAQPPLSQVGAPMREMVTEPVQGAESPGTSRMVSERPEAVVGQQAPGSVVSGVPTRSTAGPVAIGAPGEGGEVVAAAPWVQPMVTSGGGEPTKPTTGSAEGDWAKYHGNEGVMPAGYHGEGGGQPSQTTASAPVAAAPAIATPATTGQVLGTQIKPAVAAPYTPWQAFAAEYLTPESQRTANQWNAMTNALKTQGLPTTITPTTTPAPQKSLEQRQLEGAKESIQYYLKNRKR